MKAKLLLIFILIELVAFRAANAQDTIVKRNGETIKCMVKEIGTTEIKYTQEEFRPGLVFTVEKKLVQKIVFSDGKTWEYDRKADLMESMETNSQELMSIQKRNAWKIDFLSLITSGITLTYERCLKPSNSIEFSLGYIGVGLSKYEDNASGLLFRGGYKLIKSPDFFLRDMRYAHILKGGYVKFELDLASYGIDKNSYMGGNERITISKWAIMVVPGKQFIFNDKFLVDFYFGIGFGRNNQDESEGSWAYGFATGTKEFAMAASSGLRIGFLTK
jgi:hypothetical protein